LLIFDYIIEGNGNIPPLMEALIGDQVLYREAVQEEYCSNELREEDGSTDIQSITKFVIE
jgi:hypothetical protein